MKHMIFITAIILILSGSCYARDYTNSQIANAIYRAEGGAGTKHPYGILKKYKHTTARQACINTIKHARRDYRYYRGREDFISYLGARYCPVGAKNDPKGLNKNWIKNVRRFLCNRSQSKK